MINLSTNEIMFDCQEDLLENFDFNSHPIYRFIDDYHKYNGNEERAWQNFSHDNWNLVYCWICTFQPNLIHRLPLWGRHSLHPIRFMSFFIVKYPILGLVFLPFFLADLVFENLRFKKKNRHGITEITTTGKLQTYFMLRSFKARNVLFADLMFKLQTFLIEKSGYSWDQIFSIYYEPMHRVKVAYNSHIKLHGKLSLK